MRVTILDYGAGNIHSLAKALSVPGADVHLESDPVAAIDTGLFVLPGVGAFGAAVNQMQSGMEGIRAAILNGLPTLGVCLGMQLLFESSDEGDGVGLGVFPGRVTRLRAARAPQMGWNSLDDNTDPAVRGAGLSSAYYANSFVCRPLDTGVVTSWSTHESDRFPAVVRKGSTVGVQFHPEKSSAAGVRFIRQIVEEARR
jgi:glutamine amidotransferase